MDFSNHTTEHQSGKHLTCEDYVTIEIRLKDGWSLDAFARMKAELGASYSKVFGAITTDNGQEFSRLSELENGTQTNVYFAQPYTSCEKGSIENRNGMIRRFIPKGKRIEDYSD